MIPPSLIKYKIRYKLLLSQLEQIDRLTLAATNVTQRLSTQWFISLYHAYQNLYTPLQQKFCSSVHQFHRILVQPLCYESTLLAALIKAPPTNRPKNVEKLPLVSFHTTTCNFSTHYRVRSPLKMSYLSSKIND